MYKETVYTRFYPREVFIYREEEDGEDGEGNTDGEHGIYGEDGEDGELGRDGERDGEVIIVMDGEQGIYIEDYDFKNCVILENYQELKYGIPIIKDLIENNMRILLYVGSNYALYSDIT